MKTSILQKVLNYLIIGLFLVLIITNSKPVEACEGASFVANLTLTDNWQLYEDINAGTYYTIEAAANDVILVSFCQAGAFYVNNPMTEISAISGTQLPKSNDDFCGYGSELIFICETTGTYKIAFYQSGCISDNSELGTMAIKLVRTPTVQDCLGAIPLCTEYYEDTVSVSGSGNYYDLFNFNEQDSMSATTNNCPNCLVTGEINAKWFTFQIYESGSLGFVINPVDNNDDYDWAIFKLNDTIGCESLIRHQDYPPIRCNFAFIDTQSGNTGLGSGLSACEGPVEDEGFTTSLNTFIGEKFVLVVSNFSSTQNGFSIDFSPSVANIIDTTPPQISHIVYDPQWASSIINLQFSENILCGEIQATDFMLSGPDGFHQINEVYSNISVASSVNTYNGHFYDDIWTLVLDEQLNAAGDYTLVLQANSILDNCFNENQYQEIYFSIDNPEIYTLTVNTVGEGIVEVDAMAQSSTYSVIENSNLQVSAIPEFGWQFDSWSGDLSGANNVENILMDANKTITATFTESPPIYDTLTINYAGMGHVEIDGIVYTEPVLVERYSTHSLFAIAEDGWQFDHWEDSLIGNINPQSLFVFANEQVKAIFTEIPLYTLEIEVIGQGNVDVNGVLYESILSFEENSTIELSATPEDGWYFSHWEDSLTSFSNPLSFNLNNNKFAIAVFLEIQFYNLEIAIVGQGSVNVNNVLYESVLSFQENSDIDLYADPESGWYFSHWEDSLTGSNNPELINIHSHKFIKAVFIEYPLYNLEINIVGMGTVEVNGITYEEITSYSAPTLLMLNAVASEGWQFSHWEDSLTGTQNPAMVIMLNHRSITAVFTEIPEYFLYIDVSGNGTIEINDIIYESPMLIEEGSLLTIKAIPFENFMFSNWAGDLSGNTNPETILMESELNIEAIFLNISGINNLSHEEIIISPNPFDNQVNISNPKSNTWSKYEIYNSIGQLILSGNFATNTCINTQELKSGIYFLKIKSDLSEKCFKIIKE